MDVDLFEWDWQSEYKHRGTMNYENRTHYRQILLKERSIVTLDEKVVPKTQSYVSLRRWADYDDEVTSRYEMVMKPKPSNKKSSITVYTIPEGRKLRWGRTGRKGYILHREEEEFPSEDKESESDTEEFQMYERWPSPAPHKGGCPYTKPMRYSDLNKGVGSKTNKRKDWLKQCDQEAGEDFYKKKKAVLNKQKVSIIDMKKHRYLSRLYQRAKVQVKKIKNFEQIRAERRLKKEKNETSDVIPPFIENDLSINENIILKPITIETPLNVEKHEEREQSDTVKSQKTSEENSAVDQDGNNFLLIKLLRESTRPDTLHTEFRYDYKEAACKPRRFVINISRIVFHHVTLMNRLRLRIIPKLDLTTYLVFSYSKEWAPGVDLFRVHVASMWASSVKKVLFNSSSTPKDDITQIQELIQSVTSAIDSIDLRQLVAQENKRNKSLKKKDRPSCNFSMLRSVIKWEFTSTSLPRAIEWYTKEDTEDKAQVLFDGLRHIFDHGNTSVREQFVKRGPNEPDICGGCLLKTASDGTNNLVALDTCSHWFCEQCWKSRLTRQIKKADMSQKSIAQCVEKGCNNLVDPISLITLLSLKKIRSTIERRLRKHVSTLSPLVIICPKENCRQVFSLLGGETSTTGKMALPIVCRCSHQFCSNCLNSPHWPLTCEYYTRYTEFINQRRDDISFSKLLLDHELPDDLLSGKRCNNCGRFVRHFVYRKTEPNEFGESVCLQCAKEGGNRNDNTSNRSKSIHDRNLLTNEPELCKLTKWYKIAKTHRKMRHPEVVKALYQMAGIVADKLACAVTTGKYVGDAKRAATEWDDLLLEWAEQNFSELCKSQVNASSTDSGVSSSEKQPLPVSIEICSRTTSASSNFSSTNSTSRSATLLSSKYCNALSNLSTPGLDDESGIPLDIKRAACNIVNLKLELHAIAEYVAVLLDYHFAFRGRLVRCLERAEDLCFSLGILLQDPHVHNAPRILPTFMRLRIQAKHAIENIHDEIKNANLDAKLIYIET